MSGPSRKSASVDLAPPQEVTKLNEHPGHSFDQIRYRDFCAFKYNPFRQQTPENVSSGTGNILSFLSFLSVLFQTLGHIDLIT